MRHEGTEPRPHGGFWHRDVSWTGGRELLLVQLFSNLDRPQDAAGGGIVLGTGTVRVTCSEHSRNQVGLVFVAEIKHCQDEFPQKVSKANPCLTPAHDSRFVYCFVT